MEKNDFYTLHFDLYKIKDVDVLNNFKKKVETKLREANIKYDINLIDDLTMKGGGYKTTYPYNIFESTIDSIVGIKRSNVEERKNLFDRLFTSPGKPIDEKKETVNTPVTEEKKEIETPITSDKKETTGFFDYFLNSNKPVEIKKVEEEKEEDEDEDEEEEEKDDEEEEKDEEEKDEEEEEKDEEEEEKDEEEKDEEEKDEEEKDEEKDQDDAEKEEDDAEKDEEGEQGKTDEETMETYVKTQDDIIKVDVIIYHDDKNEKILPIIIGMRKWIFK